MKKLFPLDAIYDWNNHADYKNSLKSQNKVISATQLIKPIKQLYFELNTNIKRTNNSSALMGTAFHSYAESLLNKNDFYKFCHNQGYALIDNSKDKLEIEKVFTKSISDYYICGTVDLIFNNQIHDYKTMKVKSFQNQNIQKIINQLSVYRWLVGDRIKDKCIIHYVLTDYSKFGKFNDEQYPQDDAFSIEYDLIPLNKMDYLILNKLDNLKKIENNNDIQNKIWNCSDNDLLIEKKYGVKKKGNKRNTKLLNTEKDAKIWIGDKKDYEITEVKSKSIVCNNCRFLRLCNQGKSNVI